MPLRWRRPLMAGPSGRPGRSQTRADALDDVLRHPHTRALIRDARHGTLSEAEALDVERLRDLLDSLRDCGAETRLARFASEALRGAIEPRPRPEV